jgi:aconitate hydratase
MTRKKAVFMDDSHDTLAVDQTYSFISLRKIARHHPPVSSLPYALKILLENTVRNWDGTTVRDEDAQALLAWTPENAGRHELAFTPARVLLQDFTGVPAIVDLAAMRDAMKKLGGDPGRINPLAPVELVIDHSVQVDFYGTKDSFEKNRAREFERNQERYAFLRWGQEAFRNFRVVPPDTGIVHQVNIEYLARVVFETFKDQKPWLYPDTLVGTDSHTTMVNGLGVLGWGVGGIEAEAAMLGQPMTMVVPEVIGVNLTGKLDPGATATDLVLTLTELLRRKGVVGKFVEFFGPGLAALPVADRTTISNMSPEFGSTCAIFPIDTETLRYLRQTGRSETAIARIQAYCQAQGLWHEPGQPEPRYSDSLSLDLTTVEPSMAGPSRPQDRVKLSHLKSRMEQQVTDYRKGKPAIPEAKPPLADGDLVIAAITSCTNTSNPSVMIGAGLLARNARKRGLETKPWVKTSLAPGSPVVTRYLQEAGLLGELEALGFGLVGYGCTTCIGNSGPLQTEISELIQKGRLAVGAILSGNRNFEGRIHPEVRFNFLASPPLVVAFALAGTLLLDPENEPLGMDSQGHPVYLKEIWPDPKEIEELVRLHLRGQMFQESYAKIFEGPPEWSRLETARGLHYKWSPESTYVQSPPFFEDLEKRPPDPPTLDGARVLAVLGDSVTTDHISPAGNISPTSPAGRYLRERGIEPRDFNSYGARRGNHEVMMRGTFANIRLKNLLVPGVEGGMTLCFATGETLPIYDAAMRYLQKKVPLVILAGKEYGSGSSRDWAAKGPALLGVKAILAESFERIHRSNLVGMGILPLEFLPGENAQVHGLTGHESYQISGFQEDQSTEAVVVATSDHGQTRRFKAKIRLDTPKEKEYYRHGGILKYVLRTLAGDGPDQASP